MRRVQSVELVEGLGIRVGDLMSLVGGGGKTTLLYRTAETLRRRGLRVAVGTTTKIGPPRAAGRCLVLAETYHELVEALPRAPGLPVLGCRRLGNGKVQGISPEWCDRIVAESRVDCLIVEADGASQKPLKAPEAWEPVVPAVTSLFVPVVGLSCLGRPLGPEGVFRVGRVSEVTDLQVGERITVAALIQLLSSARGLLKGCPPGARSVAILNQVDVCDDLEGPREIARALLGASYERVLLAALGKEDRIREVWLR